jgi:hypothetical protein
MSGGLMFLDCPQDLDRHGTTTCGLPAAVEYRYPIRSNHGTRDGVKIRCPRGHWFLGPADALAAPERADAARVKDAAR